MPKRVIPVTIGRVAALRDLQHIEAELGPDVGQRIIPIGHSSAEFPAERRIRGWAPQGLVARE